MRWAYPGGPLNTINSNGGAVGYEETMGLFYNGLVALEEVCPTGYHVASLSDYEYIADLYGGLNEAGVAMIPGTAFGKFAIDNVRFNFANSRENISKAIEKIHKILK